MKDPIGPGGFGPGKSGPLEPAPKETVMKRYILFLGQQFYPLGGINDYYGSFHTLTEAKTLAQNRLDSTADWAHIVDSIHGETVWRSGQ